MRIRTCMLALLAGTVLAGCQAQKAYDRQLVKAQRSLEMQLPEMAQRQIDKAQTIAAKNHLHTGPEAKLLLAEAHLQMGNLSGTEALAREVADEYVPGTISRARAEEILAKVALRQGDFLAATAHLNEAERGYNAPEDLQRTADLLHLVRGLEAYGDGNSTVAIGHWNNISDPAIRQSLKQGMKSH